MTDHVRTCARGNKGKGVDGGGEEKVGAQFSRGWTTRYRRYDVSGLVTLSIKNSLAAATSDNHRSSPRDIDLQGYSRQLLGREIPFDNRTDSRDSAIIVPS